MPLRIVLKVLVHQGSTLICSISSDAVQVQSPEVDGQVLRQLMDNLQGLPQHAKTVAGGIQQVS